MHKNQSTALMGSIAQIAKDKGISEADAMLSATTVVAVDTSASMSDEDAGEGRNEERYEVACRELAAIQAARPGQIVVLSWSSSAQWCPDGVPANQGSGTCIMSAIRAFLDAGLDGLLNLTIIADGDVNEGDRQEALAVVPKMQSRVDTIFIGNTRSADGKAGAAFLKELARRGRGTHAATLKPGMLAKPAMLMIGPPNDDTAPNTVINL